MQDKQLERLARLAGASEVNTPSAVTMDAPTSFSVEELQGLRAAMDEEAKEFAKTKEQLEVEEDAWSKEDSLASAQRFFSSMALGWGDEIGLWTAAIAVDLTTGKPVKEVYAEMRRDYDRRQEAFEGRQEGAALASDIAGGFASPAMALKAATTLGKVGARAVGEGAIYGAGAAEEGQRLEGAAGGAAGGALGFGAVTAATKGLGKGVDFFTRRRVEGDLVDADGDFVPITLAASNPKGSEGLIHTFYRDVVAPSFGAKGVIKEQEQRIVGKAEDYLESQKEFSNKLDAGLKQKQEESSDLMTSGLKALEAERKALVALKKEETDGKILPLEQKLQALNTGKAEEIVNKAASDFRKAQDARRFDFRNEAFLRSFPVGATSKDVEDVLAKTDIGQRAKALDEVWSAKGYSMLDNRKFRFKSGELRDNLEKALIRDDYFITNTVDVPAVMKVFDNAVETTNFFRDKSGRVDGSLVSSLRSRIGTLANKTTDPQNKRALYTLQDEINKIMRKQLSEADKLKLDQEAGKWKTNVVLREAIEGAQRDPKKRGAFDEADWIKEVSRNNRWDSRYGTGPLNKTARTLEYNLGQAEKSIAKRATNLAKTKAKLVEAEMRDHKNKLSSALNKIDKTLDSKKKALVRKPALAEEIASDINRKQLLESELKVLNKELDQLKQLRASGNPSWFHTLVATSFLVAGGVGGGVSGALTTAGAGYGIGRALAAPQAQRIVAGQTPTQQNVQRMLQSDATGRTAEILQRAGGVAGSRSGMFTDQ